MIDLDEIAAKYPWLERAVQSARAHVDAADVGSIERKRASDRERRAANLRASRIPLEEHMPKLIIDGALERTQSWAAVSSIVAAVREGYTPRKIVALLGDMGRGKTTAGAGAIAELGGEYSTLDDLVDLWRLAKKNKGERIELQRYLEAKVLVLDEVQISSTRIEERVDAKIAFHKIIDRRVGLRGVTILNSNRTELELREAFDDVTFDRLGALWQVVVNEGASFRVSRRPWREALGGRKPWNLPEPLPKTLTKADVLELLEDARTRESRLRAYYEGKPMKDEERVDVLVELGGALYMATSEIRAAEAA